SFETRFSLGNAPPASEMAATSCPNASSESGADPTAGRSADPAAADADPAATAADPAADADPAGRTEAVVDARASGPPAAPSGRGRCQQAPVVAAASVTEAVVPAKGQVAAQERARAKRLGAVVVKLR
ncbi:MAG TPA: hypothetical protein VFS00_05970, partial [Polyangiaceae bacterium]|nr:hypothetical protein [Polyangiaceae bacterium]